jgi:hypothetical protein
MSAEERQTIIDESLDHDAGPGVALAAHELALRDGHPEAAVDQMARAVLAAGSSPYRDHVVAHAASPLAISIA